jgi:transcriptional regulator GlxA family with amidase domain
MQPAVHRVQDAVSQSPQADWTVQRMAEVACTSPRHLARLFSQHAGVAPLAYVQGIRLDVAEAALRSGHNVGQAAELAGFASDLQLRRTWKLAAKPGTPRGARARDAGDALGARGGQ